MTKRYHYRYYYESLFGHNYSDFDADNDDEAELTFWKDKNPELYRVHNIEKSTIDEQADDDADLRPRSTHRIGVDMEKGYIEQAIRENEDKELFVRGPLTHLARCINEDIVALVYEKQGEGCEVVHVYLDCTCSIGPKEGINVTGNSLRAIAEAVLVEI